jgi:quinolinate synthase
MGELQDKILELKKEKDFVILGHNYQIPEIQDISDFLGDSLQLSRTAAEVEAQNILFCGVDFMAQTAKMLNPSKRVFIPAPEAVCPMAAALTVETLKAAQVEHPDAATVMYVNTTADVKAESTIVCTSSNADKVVNSLDEEEVIFGPDKNLAWYVEQRTSKKILPVPDHGFCYVHRQFTLEHVKKAREQYPEAKIVVHPECEPEVQKAADEILSTGGMVRISKEDQCKEFVMGTEIGILYRLKKENPGKQFYPLLETARCLQMKKNNLEKVYQTMKDESNEVTLSEDIINRARSAVERMLTIRA